MLKLTRPFFVAMLFIIFVHYLVHGASIDASPAPSVDSEVRAMVSYHCTDLTYCRTIWRIVWSFLVTIFSYTWVAVHPNAKCERKYICAIHCCLLPSMITFLCSLYVACVRVCAGLGDKAVLQSSENCQTEQRWVRNFRLNSYTWGTMDVNFHWVSKNEEVRISAPSNAPSLAATSDIVLDKVTTCHCFPPNVICLVSVRASILMSWIRPSCWQNPRRSVLIGAIYGPLYGLQTSPWYGFWKLRLMSSGVNISVTIASDCFSIQVNQPVQNPNTVSWVLIIADLWSIWPQIAASHVFISYIKMALLA